MTSRRTRSRTRTSRSVGDGRILARFRSGRDDADALRETLPRRAAPDYDGGGNHG